MEQLPILFEDEWLIAIFKPHGLLVHRSKLAADAKEFALQKVRDQVGMKVYPCHRLDRKTCGILLFAKEETAHKHMMKKFADREISKEYQAIVRGWIGEKGTIDYPLKTERGASQEAVTDFERMDLFEIDWPLGKHQTSRYSEVRLFPKTGRMHQIRRHLSHIFHPIIGDRPHGCNKQNRLWKERVGMETMLLAATKLSFAHPITDEHLEINSEASGKYLEVKKLLRANTSKTLS